MYLIDTKVKESNIDGRGVFTLQKITKGEVVWKFDPKYDQAISIDQFKALDITQRSVIERIAYLSPTSNKYVYPPESDPARFTNHSASSNLSVLIDLEVSEEPYFIANRNIEVGEELTNNYTEFDKAIENHRPNWVK